MSLDDRPIQDIGIPDAEVSRILDRLDNEEFDVKRSERGLPRRFQRGTAVVALVLDSGVSALAYRVRLRNLSRQGVAFLSPVGLTIGSRLRIELPIGPDLGAVEEGAVVVRCRAVEEGIYEVGAELSGR